MARLGFAADDENECVAAVRNLLTSEHELVFVATQSMPWPDMSVAVAEAVAAGTIEYGVLMCWTGTGTAIAANKVHGVRAATVTDSWTARGARLWNDANVIALSLKRLAPDVAVECVRAFLDERDSDPEEASAIQRLRDLDYVHRSDTHGSEPVR